MWGGVIPNEIPTRDHTLFRQNSYPQKWQGMRKGSGTLREGGGGVRGGGGGTQGQSVMEVGGGRRGE